MKRMQGLLVRMMMGISAAIATGCAAPSDDEATGVEAESSVETFAQELSTSTLTKKQARTVLDLVDDICGDSWCEGDHNFHFDQIQCTRPCGKTPGTCRLAFRLFPYDSDLESGPTYTRTCKTLGFTGFSSLVETAQNGYQSLNWAFYDALSACISKLESELPPV